MGRKAEGKASVGVVGGWKWGGIAAQTETLDAHFQTTPSNKTPDQTNLIPRWEER